MSGESDKQSTSGDSGVGATMSEDEFSDEEGTKLGIGTIGEGGEDVGIMDMEIGVEVDTAKMLSSDKRMDTTEEGEMLPPPKKGKGVSKGRSGIGEKPDSTRHVLAQVKNQPWYVGEVDRPQAEKFLRNKPAGAFMVRYSKKPPIVDKDGYIRNRDRVVLSNLLNDGRTVKHTEIKSHDESVDKDPQIFMVFLSKIPRKTFENVTDLLEYYTKVSLREVDHTVFKTGDTLKYYFSMKNPLQPVDMGREIIRRRSLSPRQLERTCPMGDSGGVLQQDNSDVRLVVPPGAIPAGLTYTIENKIHVTNLDDFRSHTTSWGKDEHFIGPAAEYNITQVTGYGKSGKGSAEKFRKYVEIRIGHCINDEKFLRDIKVYCSDPEKKEFGKRIHRAESSTDGSLPQSSSGSALDCYFTVDSQYVYIHTLHFTQYFCTCTSTNPMKLQMETLLFAGTKDYSDRQQVEISVYLCEALFRLREFKQVIIEDEAQQDPPRRLITRNALTLPPSVRHDDQFQVYIEPFLDEEDVQPGQDPLRSPWKPICAQGMTATKFLNVSAVLECPHICQGGIPPTKPKDVKFHLQNRGPKAESFTGILHANVAAKNGNPSYDQANLNHLAFTVDLRGRDSSQPQLQPQPVAQVET